MPLSRPAPRARLRRLAAGAATVVALIAGASAPRALERQVAEQVYFERTAAGGTTASLYAPKPGAGGEPPAPVLFFSGEWGWTPMLQDAATRLAFDGHAVLGVASPDYFKRPIESAALAADLRAFAALLNERAGRPKDAPVVLAGYAYGAQMVPYVANRIPREIVSGALLLAAPAKGSSVFRATVMLKMPPLEKEAFDVAAELGRLAPVPVVIVQGTLDADSAGPALQAHLRGPNRYIPITGADRQFKPHRAAFLIQVGEALRFIQESGRTAPSGAR